jgi:hypothetical protein
MALNLEMVQRGVLADDLAEALGVGREGMVTAISRGVPAKAQRWQIENYLGFPLTLWSPPEEIKARKRCVREFGLDPRELPIADLRDFCRKRGTERPRVRTREAWFQMLVKWCQRNPEVNRTTEPNKGDK